MTCITALLSQERLELFLSWRHSGFSVHNDVRLAAGDTKALEALVRYMMRPTVGLARLLRQPDQEQVLYFPKLAGHDRAVTAPERIDSLEFVARVVAQIPEPRRHSVRDYGRYSNVARGKRKRACQENELACAGCRHATFDQRSGAVEAPIVCPCGRHVRMMAGQCAQYLRPGAALWPRIRADGPWVFSIAGLSCALPAP